jgi:hypothetical protein
LYGGYPAEFAGLTQNSKKIVGTSNQPFIQNEKFSKKKYVYYLKSVKEPKTRTWRNLQAWPNILKILLEHRITKSTNQNENFPKKKTIFRTLKV